MLRRTAVAVLLGAGADGIAREEKLPGGPRGAALPLEYRTRRPIAVEASDFARQGLLPPGSALKPLTLRALLEASKTGAGERFPCQVKLSITGRSFACSHPQIGAPLGIPTAIA